MARVAPERWVNAVITLTIPLDISPEASEQQQTDAVISLFEARFPDLGDDCVASMRCETVEG